MTSLTANFPRMAQYWVLTKPRVTQLAVFCAVIGMFLANFVAGIVHAAARNTNIPSPELLGRVSRYAIVIFAVSMSLEELGIAPLLVGTTFNIFFGAICFGLALAFGLGGRDAAAKFIEDLRKRR